MKFSKNSQITILFTILLSSQIFAAQIPGRWTTQQAANWEQQNGWLIGCNYIPYNAINQLEMWQADTFDPDTIDKELAMAEDLGFNSLRVYLHDLLWKQDSKGFLERMETFLEIADRHKIKIMFVLFDGVWDPNPKLGKQRAPVIGAHNSGWLQSPGVAILSDPKRHDEMADYVKGVVTHFKDDKRIILWDVFNEPENANKGKGDYPKFVPENKAELARLLFEKSVSWIREINPSHPITSAVWYGKDWSTDKRLNPLQKSMFSNSDIITFHCYYDANALRNRIKSIRRFGRPILCTEYLTRPRSTFIDNLPVLHEEKVGAYNWGFVAGKTQTIYAGGWGSPHTAEPPVWYCDIFREDGSAYDENEIKLIKKLTGKK